MANVLLLLASQYIDSLKITTCVRASQILGLEHDEHGLIGI